MVGYLFFLPNTRYRDIISIHVFCGGMSRLLQYRLFDRA
jgi:hypothetical protein